MRVLLTFLMASVIVVSGCVEGDDDSGDDDTSSTDDGAGTNNTTLEPAVFDGSGTATVSTSAGGLSQGGLDFTVDPGATLLYAELAWDDPVADLDLALASPASDSQAGEVNWDHSAEGGMPGSPDSPHSLTLESPQDGTWQGGAIANGAAANVAYRIAVTVFYGETSVPEGYTALA